MTTKITNTTAQVYNNPHIALSDMLIGGPGAIERSEALGQQELLNSSVLPTDGLRGPGDRAALEAVGIAIGDPVAGDEMFTNVTLPPGWKKRPTDHSMWSDLIDAKGRIRAKIFYKAAFYDRSARFSLVKRFIIDRDYDRADHRTVVVIRVKDCDEVVFSSEPVTIDPKDWAASDRATTTGTDQCKAWLVDHAYADYANVAAYWE